MHLCMRLQEAAGGAAGGGCRGAHLVEVHLRTGVRGRDGRRRVAAERRAAEAGQSPEEGGAEHGGVRVRVRRRRLTAGPAPLRETGCASLSCDDVYSPGCLPSLTTPPQKKNNSFLDIKW